MDIMKEDYMSVYLKGVYDERDKWKSNVKEKIEEIFKILDKIPNVIIELDGNVILVKREIADVIQELLKED